MDRLRGGLAVPASGSPTPVEHLSAIEVRYRAVDGFQAHSRREFNNMGEGADSVTCLCRPPVRQPSAKQVYAGEEPIHAAVGMQVKTYVSSYVYDGLLEES